MRLTLAGCPIVVAPDDALRPRERDALERLRATSPCPASDTPPFRLHLVDEPPWPSADLAGYPDGGPADVSAAGDVIRVTHRRFAAALDPAALSGRLFRPDTDSAAVEITVRVALSARLPALGVLPLHAAGILLDGTGHVFFGPSGAGKSTLSSLAPGAVLSDELVAVAADPAELRSTGFWGEMNGEGTKVPASAPLGTLVELARGPSFRLERLEPTLALRRLLGVVLVPPLPRLWAESMSLAGRLVRDVPVYRMEWSPDAPPWTALRAALLSA